MNPSFAFASLLALGALAACGSAGPAPTSDPAQVTIALKGAVQALPLPASETLPSFSGLQMRLFDANAIWRDTAGGQNPAATSLYNQALMAISSSCAVAGCPYSIASQNIAGVGPNLVALVNGSSGLGDRYWAPTYTNIVDDSALLFAQQHRGTLAATAPAYVISQYGLGQLAYQLGLQNAARLLDYGLIIGLVRAKDAANYSGGPPGGVAGARITLTAQQAALVDLHYPNADYSSAVGGVSTNSDGVFYLVGKAAGTSFGPTTLDIEAGASSDTWAHRPIAMIRGSVVLAPLQAAP